MAAGAFASSGASVAWSSTSRSGGGQCTVTGAASCLSSLSVQLDLDHGPRGGDLVSQRTVHLRHHPERERILHGARVARLRQLAARQQVTEMGRRGDLAGQRLCPRRLVVERPETSATSSADQRRS